MTRWMVLTAILAAGCAVGTATAASLIPDVPTPSTPSASALVPSIDLDLAQPAPPAKLPLSVPVPSIVPRLAPVPEALVVSTDDEPSAGAATWTAPRDVDRSLSYIASPRAALDESTPASGFERAAPQSTTPRAAPAPSGAPPAHVATTFVPHAPTSSAPHAAAVGAAMGGLAVLAGFALYHRIRPTAALENETRKVIFDAVCGHPGLGVHALATAAGVSYSTATYHLDRLVVAGMIVVTPAGNKLCYYKNGGAFTEAERKILPILKNDEATRLLDAILASPGTYRAALAERLGVTATTINWHLKRLREAGLVRETREGRNAYLHVDEDVMRTNIDALLQKVGTGDHLVAARLRKYAPAASS